MYKLKEWCTEPPSILCLGASFSFLSTCFIDIFGGEGVHPRVRFGGSCRLSDLLQSGPGPWSALDIRVQSSQASDVAISLIFLHD